MKKLVVIVLIACQLISCNSKKKEDITKITSEDTENVIEESDSLGQVTVYEGLLPCADCAGVETELKIYQGDGTIESHKFELTTVYKGKQPYKKFVDQGNYNLERGLGDDPDGTIYVLNDTKPEAEQVFYGYSASDPDKIYLLNNKREKIDSKIDYSLKLKKQQN
jgi:copper homeostasis protein (lipoprotein)